MKDVIGSILDIENKASEIIEDGKIEKSRLDDKLKQDIKKMQDGINAMVRTKLKQLNVEEAKDAKASLSRINKAAEKQLDEMEKFYKENRAIWVDTVFKILIGSEEIGS
ncbi:MAG: hypothetical protein KAH14_06370 [Clostridiales bacterium]|nr:hypothetical protein [Clostridiales bacterium]